MKIYTENSVYEFDQEQKQVRRLPFNSSNPLRADNDWKHYITFHYEIGEPMRLVTEHLGGEKGSLTLRTTSTVIKVEE